MTNPGLDSIGVLGRGVVGRAVESLFDGRRPVVAWDPTDGTAYPEIELRNCACVFICVPTPETAEGHANTQCVEEAIARVPNDRLVLKSTVPPGSTAELAARFDKEICFWPEYIGESAYHNPFFPSQITDMPFAIIGGEPSARKWALDLLVWVLGPTKTYFQCSSLEAELIKYAENAFFATKVTFANEFSAICEAFGADWHTVREGWVLDPRISPMHTAVFVDEPGFGGKCLPKDMRAIIEASRDAGYEPTLLSEVLESNQRFRQDRSDDSSTQPER